MSWFYIKRNIEREKKKFQTFIDSSNRRNSASETGIYDVTEFYTAGGISEYPFGIRSVVAFS